MQGDQVSGKKTHYSPSTSKSVQKDMELAQSFGCPKKKKKDEFVFFFSVVVWETTEPIKGRIKKQNKVSGVYEKVTGARVIC